ncbi:MAG: isoprenylcysteine carboxylmethyltransferase family protein [Calditrichota bacterium]
MHNPLVSITTVFVQFACIAYLIIDGPFRANTTGLIILQLAGFALGGWAVFTMRRFNVAPDPLANATLATFGPYRWIRHPMYTALLLIALAAVLSRPTEIRIVVLVILLMNLLVKLRHEEMLLKEKFSGYSDYMSRTKRLLPGIY